ncbi:glycosyltransferase family 1 protein [Actinoplanes oblitus]|uniref:Glycosyltransferase family 1 protein n=1 Tax=Actinoplanes oblitus TaxID=3040509 RepID=A0ABY8WEX0_9ACTN|nr:glycosyltransferase family 1 protein [Actinoplanes oblitus]WIM95942.1 glycosyltransferase family 1 protein [Actinoplanes oblitus]
MTRVLIVSNGVPGRPAVLADTLRRLRASGALITLAAGAPAERIALPGGGATVHAIRTARQLPRPDKRAYPDAGKGRKLWLRARHDRRLRSLARAADVLVALDPHAVHTVWQLARRHRAADAVNGLTPALRAVAARAGAPGRYRLRRLLRPGPSPAVAAEALGERADRLVERVARKGSGRRVLRDPHGRRAWRLLLGAPLLGDARRLRWTERVAGRLVELGLPDEAGLVRAAAARRARPTVAVADSLETAAQAEFAAGRIPVFLRAAAAAQLRLADLALARDDLTEATRRFAKVIPLLFHRAVHFDSLESPSARDPYRNLGDLHASATGRALAAPRGRRVPAAPPPDGRPHRLLFVTHTNVYFLTEIIERYRAHPDVEVRHLELTADPAATLLSKRTGRLIRHQLGGASDYGDALREVFAPDLAWADTVFVDWCLGHAAMLATLDPGPARVIVRLHSYEAFTVFPHLLDLSRVDDLVFVSEPLREFATAAIPRLRQPGAPRTPVLTNAARLDRYRLPKPDTARFTLGLVGVGAIAKDPRWALRVLRELRRHDERYRLMLIGKELDEGPNAVSAAYFAGYAAELAELDGRGALVRAGQTDDVPGALTEVGVVLSTSVRESFHLGLIEGAASGAVPVVRDWPFFAGQRAGARSIFPAGWVVRDPAEAVRRILAETATAAIWRAAGAAAAEHALATWDWSVTAGGYDELILGTRLTRAAASGAAGRPPAAR